MMIIVIFVRLRLVALRLGDMGLLRTTGCFYKSGIFHILILPLSNWLFSKYALRGHESLIKENKQYRSAIWLLF